MSIEVSDRSIDLELITKIKEISGQDVFKCMQCGTCASACPMRDLLDLSSTRLMHMIQFGQEDHIMNSRTCWICASCQQCMVRCPRGIDVAAVMETVRQLVLRKNENYIEPFEIEDVGDLPQIAAVSSFRKHTA